MTEEAKIQNILYKYKGNEYGTEQATQDVLAIISHNNKANEMRWLKLSTALAIAAAIVGGAIGHAIVHSNNL